MDLCLLCTPDPPILCYNYGARELYLEAQNFCGDDKRAITIYADSIDYDNKVYGWGAKFGDYSKNCGLDFYLDTTANNYLRITRFDGHIHGVMSAEFEFTFLNKTCPTMDTIKLQGGRFDVRVDF